MEQEVPNDLQAEQLLLGSLLANNSFLEEILPVLSPESFYSLTHKKIFEAILHICKKDLIANAVTLKNYLQIDSEIKDIVNNGYLADLSLKATLVVDVVSIAKIIQELYVRRQIIKLGQYMVINALKPLSDINTKDQIEEAEKSLFDLASFGEGDASCEHISNPLSTAMQKAMFAFENKSPFQNISTGFRDLDNLLGGFQNSDLIILASRPSMGKTSLAISMSLRIALEMSKKELSVCFFSLEMSSDQIASRILSVDSCVDAFSLRTGRKFSEESLQKVAKSADKISKLPFFIDDTPALAISELRAKARRLHRKNKIGIIVVDYLQLLRSSSRSKDANRVQEISEITQGLKSVAKELNVPVIALSQLSRLVEQREDKRPQLSDLRESGSIEQDADVVMFIFREAYYMMRRQPQDEDDDLEKWQSKMENIKNKAEIIIAKQRNGPVGTAMLFFDQSTTTFADLFLEDIGIS